MTDSSIAHPPETLEGWFALHQIFLLDKRGSAGERAELTSQIEQAASALNSAAAGWSRFVRLIGSTADLMVIHFRDSLDEIGRAQDVLGQERIARAIDPIYTFLSVTEAGLYHISAELARSAAARGGKVGDEEYTRALREKAAAERSSEHIRRRLYPEPPAAMPYVCFYPMSKRRDAGQNWYALSLDERSRLMQAHGVTGRRYAGRVQQVITGAIGLDAWEWGVTLFAGDPLEFKKLVTEMRFDEVSAKYAEFGEFYVGRVVGAD